VTGPRFEPGTLRIWEPGTLVSIVSDYGLDDRAIGVRSLAEAKDFSSSLCVQTGSGAHPASCTMGTVGPFPGGKAWLGRDADLSPPSASMTCSGTALLTSQIWSRSVSHLTMIFG
jgi:hypothetical protein